MLTIYFRSKSIKLLLVGSLVVASVPSQTFGGWWSHKKKVEVSIFNRGAIGLVRKHPALILFGASVAVLCAWVVYNLLVNKPKKKPESQDLNIDNNSIAENNKDEINKLSDIIANGGVVSKKPKTKYKLGFVQKKSCVPRFDSAMQFDKWKSACQALPKYGDVSLGKNDKYNNTPLTRKEFERVVCELADVMQKNNFSFNNNWVGSNGPQNAYFELSDKQDFDKFFVQKLVCDKDAQVVMHADIHADIHSTVAYVEDLVKKNWVDKNFKITNPNLYIVFLGDYSDRGYYGAEVLYTVARLKIANPDRVIMLRGNHEDININCRYGLIQEEIGWFNCQDGELIAKFGFARDYANQLVTLMYRMMPAALFVGRESKDVSGYIDYALFCHGGIEPGFNPRKLLSDSRKNLNQWIDTLSINWLDKKLKNLLIDEAGISEVDRQVPFRLLGFTWNDFLLNKKNIAECSNGRGPSLGMDVSKQLLKCYGSEKDKYRVNCVFRGHQHGGKMFCEMKEYNGFYNIWSDNQFDKSLKAMNLVHALPVWVLNVSPCSVYGKGSYNYDTYGLLNLNGKYESWVLEPHNVLV